MLTVYYKKIIDGIPYVPLLHPNLGKMAISTHLYENDAFAKFDDPFVSVINDPSTADAILLPHDILHLKNYQSYIHQHLDLAQKLNKKLLIFQYGDVDRSISYPNTVVFLTSQYKYKKQDNEIIMPAYVADLMTGQQVIRKKNNKPTIGFCGWAEYKNIRQHVAFGLSAFKIYLLRYITNDKLKLNYLPGVVLRNNVIKKLKNSKLIHTNFVLRKHYSGHQSTIELNPEKARNEFVANISGSDLALAIKGDGNFSLRFFEILSLGRIPLFLDTDCCLPMEDIIPYNKFIVKFTLDDIINLDKIVSTYYQNLTNLEFENMQKLARRYYEKYLRINYFFKYVFIDNHIKEYLYT